MGLLLVVVAAAALPYGAVLPRAQVRMEVLAALALVLAAIYAPSLSPVRPALPSLLFALGLLALGIVQLLPGPLAGVVSPSSAAAWSEASRLLAFSGGAAPLPARISIAPMATMSVVLLAASYAAVALTALLVLDTRARRRLFLGVLIAAGVLHLVYAVAEGRGTSADRVHGTFVNPNHLAGYLTLALFLALGLLLTAIARRPDPHRRHGVVKGWVARALLALLWATLAGGIAITKSRGALAASLLTTALVLLVWSLLRSSRRRVAGAWLAAFCVAVLLGATLGSEPLLRFLSSDPREIGADTRVALWSSSIEAWKAYPIAGAGLGTFRDAYRPHQPEEIQGLVEQAHSEPLQMAVTGGWVGLLLAVGLLASMLVALLRGAATQGMREERALALAVSGAILTLLLHGLVEFNFSVPAIPFTLAAVWGMGMAAVEARGVSS